GLWQIWASIRLNGVPSFNEVSTTTSSACKAFVIGVTHEVNTTFAAQLFLSVLHLIDALVNSFSSSLLEYPSPIKKNFTFTFTSLFNSRLITLINNLWFFTGTILPIIPTATQSSER